MKITKNQEAIKEFAESVGISIATTRKEKQMQWQNEGDVYRCEDCGEERQIGQPWEEMYMCYKCFNAKKIPGTSYDTSTYSNSYSGNTLLDGLKADKPIEEVKAEFEEMKKENEE